MPDSTAISHALMTVLQSDPQLNALLPDGVFKNTARAGATRFGLVTLMDADDRSVFGGRAIESAMYAVKAVVLSSANGDLTAAFNRIDALLSEAQLAVTGYVFGACHRDDARPLIDYDDVDRVDPTIRYRHLGGHYRVTCSVPGM